MEQNKYLGWVICKLMQYSSDIPSIMGWNRFKAYRDWNLEKEALRAQTERTKDAHTEMVERIQDDLRLNPEQVVKLLGLLELESFIEVQEAA